MLALTAKALLTPLRRIERAVVLVEDGSIVALGAQSEIEVPGTAKIVNFPDCVLAPGLIDIHIHGSAGHDVMEADEHGRRRMEEFLVQHGVTSYYPTTVAAPLDATLRSLEHMAEGIESNHESHGSAQPLGIHLEGPFLSHARRGVHPPEHLLKPSITVFDKLWQAARGHVRVLTIAPELEGATELIAEATKRGVCVSIGHSDADLTSAQAGVAAGAHHATHTFNAMRPLDHRAPGILGEVLSNPKVTADVIADGVHVHPAVVRLVLEAKGPEGSVVITDATEATGMPEGPYKLGGIDVEVKDGRVLRDGRLAGSVLTLDRAVRNVMDYADWDLQHAVQAATLNPARVVGAQRKGNLEPQADADIVALNEESEIKSVLVKGEMVQR